MAPIKVKGWPFSTGGSLGQVNYKSVCEIQCPSLMLSVSVQYFEFKSKLYTFTLDERFIRTIFLFIPN